MDTLLTPDFFIYTCFLVAFGCFVVVEISSFMLGFTTSWFDELFPEIDTDSSVGMSLSFLGIGNLPMMAWLSLVTGTISVVGLNLQNFLMDTFGLTLPLMFHFTITLVISLVITSILSKVLGKILPKDESYAVSSDSLIGKDAVIVAGFTVTSERHAQAKIIDEHGTTHYLSVISEDGASYTSKDSVILYRRVNDYLFSVKLKTQENT